jgi:hypothetical protein
MANNLTALSPLLFSAAQTIANEPTAVLEAISNTFDDKGVAVGDKVIVPIAPPATLDVFIPSNIPPTGDSATATNVAVTITNSSKVCWNLTGEQQRSLENATIDTEWIRQMIEQGMRTLRNDAEAKAWTAALAGASRAVGTAGTTPFASDLSALAAAKRVLLNQGCPSANVTAIIDTNAGQNLRKLGVYQNFYQAGSDKQLRQGIFLPAFGIAIAESAQVGMHTAGSLNADVITTDNTVITGITLGDPLGTQVIGLGGTGAAINVTPQDALSFASDTTGAYMATSALAAPGAVILNRPGIAKYPVPQGTAVTCAASYTGNVVLEQSSVVGAIRPPIIPDNPTIQQLKISDTKTGLTFLMLDIAQYGQRTWELHLAYGFAAVQPAFICALLG